jgi:hypothetical protein
LSTDKLNRTNNYGKIVIALELFKFEIPLENKCSQSQDFFTNRGYPISLSTKYINNNIEFIDK